MKPQAVARILDANLDRAREGLRVLEEWFRFGLEEGELSAECKAMRQALARWHSDPLRLARDTPADPGTQISHPQEEQRRDLRHLLQANCSRVQEALRVLEEYGKLAESHHWVAPGLAKLAKDMRYRLYVLESELLGGSLRQRLLAAHLYLVTSPVPHWLEVVEKSLRGGVTLVQYRRKNLPDGEMLRDLKQLRQLCDRYQALMIVNDRVDLALVSQADGVHLGQTDLPVAQARHLLGSQRLIGLSTTNAEELAQALNSDVDYIGVGPVYPTPTKAEKPPAGLEYVRLAAEKAHLPWFAIGGIDPHNLPEVRRAGATRVAVVRALMEAADPTQTARTMLAELQGIPALS
ncbi:thiamine phosphate synthase [Synechococcus sp. R55.6]|jgi:thiamine-phosphate pyrophosphorylase|uniref:thiamine phosphate synthase n=1 Tax=unclassified Synechococcus TaxID=2626047 RepID=UPI0039C343EB